jgi:two-component system OmpR family sensor kinase
MLLLVTAGLLAADLATYRFLGSFLTRRVDQQLTVARQVAVQVLSAPSFRGGPGQSDQGGSILFPAATYCALVDQSGSVVRTHVFGLGLGDITPSPPALPSGLPGSNDAAATAISARFTAHAQEGSTSYRVEADAVVGGGTLVVAIPMNDVSATLHRLVLIEGAVTVGVVLALGGLAWWLVRLGFRPLVRMEETAGAIAAGDLSRRVDTADPRTEIGRLGLALNGMLAKIEEAFAQRRASEERLRRFVSDASHELRTPLTSVRGYAELYRRGAVEGDEGLERAMRRIEEESGRMGELVDELALLARLDQGRPLELEPVDLAEIASAAVDGARVADPSREIVLDAPQHVLVLGDPLRLRQVADNLMTNAREHTPAGTSVHVRVRSDGADGALEVEDRGAGIPPEHADRIFERFYRADASRSRESGGAGLGLSIVAAVAEAHGGSVAYEAPDGGGARFIVRIPRAETQARSHDVPSPA